MDLSIVLTGKYIYTFTVKKIDELWTLNSWLTESIEIYLALDVNE
jgi:hypothetical protein